MKPREKKVVYLSIWKFLVSAFIAAVFTVVGFTLGNVRVAIFFSLIWGFVLYPLFNPKTKIRWYGFNLFKAMDEDWRSSQKSFSISDDEPGIFTYTNTGFDVTLDNKRYRHSWYEIKTMLAYKTDDFTTDTICISIFCDDGIHFRITENTPGFSAFISKTNKHLQGINKTWFIDIMQPAFRMNLMLVYDRDGRTLEDVIKEYYPGKLQG